MTGPQGMGPLMPTINVGTPYKDLLVAQSSHHYWSLQTARLSGATEPDLIASPTPIDFTMNGGDVPALSSGAGAHTTPGDKGVTFVAADTERMVTGSGFDTRQSFSWSGWYRSSSMTGNGPMLFQFSILSGTSYLFLLHRDDKDGLCVQIGPSGSACFLTTGLNIADGNWHHIALSRAYSGTSSSDTWTFYVDGNQVAQSTASVMGFNPADTPSSGLFGLAGRTDGDSNVFDGDVSHVAMKIGTAWTHAQIYAQWLFHKTLSSYTPPASVSTVPFAHIDFSDSSNVQTSSGRINVAKDKTGNGRHLVGVGSNRPFTGRTVNSLAVADFQGDQFMRCIEPFGFPTGTYTYFVAGLIDDGSSINSGILTVHNNGATSDWDNQNAFVFNNGSASVLWNHIQNGVSVETNGATIQPPGVWGVRYNSAGPAQRARVPFGSTTRTATSNQSSGTANGGVMIGARYATGTVGGSAGAQRWDGTIGEILIYDTALSDADMDAVYTYLTNKWGAYSSALPSVSGTLWGKWDPSVPANVTISSGRIDQISDTSGNGRHLVSSGSNRPFSGRSAANGLAVADYQGGQHMAAIASLATSSYTIVAVLLPDRVAGGNAGIIVLAPTGASDWDNVNGLVIAETNTAHADVTANGSNAFGINWGTAGDPVAYLYRHNNTGGAGDRLYPGGGTATRSYGGTAGQGVLLGRRWASGALSTPYWDGAIGEVLVYSSALSDADMDALGNALTWKWGY